VLRCGWAVTSRRLRKSCIPNDGASERSRTGGAPVPGSVARPQHPGSVLHPRGLACFRKGPAAFPFVAFCSHATLSRRQTRFHVTLGELWEGHYLIHVSDEDGGRSFDVGRQPSRVWTANPPRWRFYCIAKHDPRSASSYSTEGDLNLEAGYIGVQYKPGDAESLAFAERIMTIVEGISTARLLRFSPKSGETLVAGETAKPIRAGQHAAEWCLKHERRVMGYACRHHPTFQDEAYRPLA